MKRAMELYGLIDALRSGMHGAPYKEPTVSSRAGTAVWVIFNVVTGGSGFAAAAGGQHASMVKLEAKLGVAISDCLGTAGEAQVVRKAYEQTTGETIEYGVRSIFGADSSTAKKLIRQGDREPLTFVSQILQLADDKAVDDIYSKLFEASDADKKAVLDDPSCLNALRALGTQALRPHLPDPAEQAHADADDAVP